MHDEIRTIHVGEKVWKWELVDGVAFPHIRYVLRTVKSI